MAMDEAGTRGDDSGDADADSDSDSETGTAGAVFEGTDAAECSDGEDNDLDGVMDCFAIGCRQNEGCCGAPAPLLDDPFDAGPAGGWRVFGSPQVASGALVVGGVEHESGLVWGAALDSHAVVEARATVNLPAGCEAGCAAYAGVGLTTQGVVGDASGVVPVAAVVLSGLDGAAHAAIDGREVGVSAPLVAPVALALRMGPDGTVTFEWTGAGAGTETISAGPATRPETDLYLAVYGRGDVPVLDVSADLAPCPGPKGGVRLGSLLSPAGWDGAGVRSPAVVAVPEGFVLYYDGARGIGRARSADGVEWVRTTDAPLVAGGSPGAIDVEPGAEDGRLLFTASGAGTIRLARSLDLAGETFEDAGDVVLPDAQIAAAGDPHPVLLDGVLHLFFTALDADGRGSIGSIRSADGGATWEALGIVLAPAESDPDGLFSPAVRAIDAGHWEMWFEVRDGLSSRIEYAVSSDGASWVRDGGTGLGTVLTPGSGFDSRAVADPFAIATAIDGRPGMRLYYAGASGTEFGIGAVEGPRP
jgi:hypothetical protein